MSVIAQHTAELEALQEQRQNIQPQAAEKPAEEVEAKTPEQVETPGKPEEEQGKPQWDKALQREQQQRANLEKQVTSLTQTIESLREEIKAQGGKPTAAQAEQIQQAKDALADVEKELGSEGFDAIEHSPKVLKTITSELRAERQRNAELEKRLAALEGKTAQTAAQAEQMAAKAQAETFWSQYTPEDRQAFEQKRDSLIERGFEGPRLQGAIDAWWESHLETKQQEQHKGPAKPSITPNGGKVVVKKGANRQPATDLTPEQIIEQGMWEPAGLRK